MPSDEWFRRTTWTTVDAESFQARLKRSRTEFHKAQYLRIQAGHLFAVGLYAPALELLEQLLRDYPVRTELASAYVLMARVHEKVGNVAETVRNYRRTLAIEAEFPNVRTNCETSFAVYIALQQLTDLYDEALSLLARFEQEGGLVFPVQRYEAAAVRALIAEERGDRETARRYAAEAYNAAAERHSGFRYHGALGLVCEGPTPLSERLATLCRRLGGE